MKGKKPAGARESVTPSEKGDGCIFCTTHDGEGDFIFSPDEITKEKIYKVEEASSSTLMPMQRLHRNGRNDGMSCSNSTFSPELFLFKNINLTGTLENVAADCT
jgi:hypothetical protein